MSTSPELTPTDPASPSHAPNPHGGPRTDAGKAASSQNAITYGLYAQRDFIRPAEEEDYSRDKADLAKALAPEGPLELSLVNEIHRAIWRLRRCGQVEANLAIGLNDGGYIFDPMETTNLHAEKTQRSVDRARAQAHRLLHKCTAELRKLQTERQYRKDFSEPEADISLPGISDMRSVRKGIAEHVTTQYRQTKLASVASSFCKTPKTAPATLGVTGKAA